MSFRSGRVTCSRFFVLGDAPAMVDEATLGILSDFTFRETPVGEPDEVEAGFVTGVHLLDGAFDYDKNGFGDALLFGLRLDTHRVPSEIKKAYEAIHRGAAEAASPTGFASRAERREAAELAQRELRDNLAKGLYRRSQMIDVVWDLKRGQLLCGATSDKAAEQLIRLMKEAFAVDLQPMSAGAWVGHRMRDKGRGRDYEDLLPTAFTPPPAQARIEHDGAGPTQPIERPLVPWVARAVDVKDWIGNEWLAWLWWVTETGEGLIDPGDSLLAAEIAITIDKTLDMDCAWDATGKQTLRGDGPTRLPEAAEALREGKWPRKFGLLLSDGEYPWELTLQGDRYTVGSAKLPESDEAQTPRDIIEHRLFVTRRLIDLIDAMFAVFVELRLSGQWPATRSEMQRWVQQRSNAAMTVEAW
ncbi:MAG: hypothetical protein AAGI54_14125 [Planctomycetota bacterium]